MPPQQEAFQVPIQQTNPFWIRALKVVWSILYIPIIILLLITGLTHMPDGLTFVQKSPALLLSISLLTMLLGSAVVSVNPPIPLFWRKFFILLPVIPLLLSFVAYGIAIKTSSSFYISFHTEPIPTAIPVTQLSIMVPPMGTTSAQGTSASTTQTMLPTQTQQNRKENSTTTTKNKGAQI